jgi:16S rRNA (cytidine1402-2'-O)-methyltransferase
MPGRCEWRSVWSLEERASFKWYNNQSLHAMSGTLYVVATPIGNLEDITLRALRVLRQTELIAAEDTRRTARLLAHHGITTPSISFHTHNARSRIPHLLSKLSNGASIALVTDAGTPGVSDPGVELVAAAITAGIPIDPIPGVSAPLTAAVASGFALDSLTILGFAPSKVKGRREFLTRLSAIPGTITFFEAPHRIAATLSDMHNILGDRPIMLGRELTKVHQEFSRGTAADLLRTLAAPLGEFTIVVGPSAGAASSLELPADAAVAREFGEITEVSGLSRRSAISTLAKKYGASARQVYSAVERAKNSGLRPNIPDE